MPLGTLDRTPPPFFKQGPSALSKLIFFSALALFLMVADTRLKISQPLRTVVATALYPVQWLLMQPVYLARNAGAYVSTVKSAQQTEGEARQKLALQALRSNQVEHLTLENNRLRKLLPKNSLAVLNSNDILPTNADGTLNRRARHQSITPQHGFNEAQRGLVIRAQFCFVRTHFCHQRLASAVRDVREQHDCGRLVVDQCLCGNCINHYFMPFKVIAKRARWPSLPGFLLAASSFPAGMGLPGFAPSSLRRAPGRLIASAIKFFFPRMSATPLLEILIPCGIV